jgi:hypothetical protein
MLIYSSSGLELMVLLPLLPKCWDYRHVIFIGNMFDLVLSAFFTSPLLMSTLPSSVLTSGAWGLGPLPQGLGTNMGSERLLLRGRSYSLLLLFSKAVLGQK